MKRDLMQQGSEDKIREIHPDVCQQSISFQVYLYENMKPIYTHDRATAMMHFNRFYQNQHPFPPNLKIKTISVFFFICKSKIFIMFLT
jgi:hypothetical protein